MVCKTNLFTIPVPQRKFEVLALGHQREGHCLAICFVLPGSPQDISKTTGDLRQGSALVCTQKLVPARDLAEDMLRKRRMKSKLVLVIRSQITLQIVVEADE